MDLLTVEDLSCPVCGEIFKSPVVLSCSHSVCKECLQQFWKTKETQECPYCGSKLSKCDPPDNLALQNLCEMYLKERKEKCLSEAEEICGLHSEKHKLFCLEDKQPACAECFTSQTHVNNTCEVVPSYKEQLAAALKSLHERLLQSENIIGEFEKTLQHIWSQADNTEHQIKQQFEKLHQFLRDEEAAIITALREEEELKKQMMREKLDEMNRHILILSHTIKDTEEMMIANDVCFLKEFPVSVERLQILSQPDLQLTPGALIHVPRYLGNLPFRIWKKMQDIIQNTPVILDPNTANPRLTLSDDLTGVRRSNYQPVPDNPERFDCYRCVLGSEGFNSGTHYWDVEVKEGSVWTLGVTTASNQRKGWDFFNTDVWSLQYNMSRQSGFPVLQQLDRVRVVLDYDGGTVSFIDPVTSMHLHTFKTTFTHTLFPFFSTPDTLRILPVSSQ
ncbi:zinc-binding protein A33-like [Puntigrus tetrazona]|uniref:zinc-binding protein A33-like n=1 Tax=Puntigrus tetrazona TaxID=1606681 RepID=UPI001C8A0AC5|nr:zinc-binding protein A33-like [Puntigrus tetrazona]